ncbi:MULTISPECIES: ABC transporter ATP-binding protein [Bacillus cereus group]|uniref:ABC transporter ATP-binding protein n=1 Tax=Bacillus cereus group TaxID=86661 RepID=UPI0001A1C6AF|nr:MULTISPECIES: ABC transporter ATP-binding protein [Bacillus cereus group]EEM69064.1 ABC transporter ATP-binding protein [Bacillus thuringiensis serovar andalousiensis BGSC 4AW1]MEB9627237.1 ABC transporter ATP-binding protein [Bacillus anthracis]OUA98259.1 ABC transporter ATP-binding protein [Bacillus thuringiensis serovar oswaldocruzi]
MNNLVWIFKKIVNKKWLYTFSILLLFLESIAYISSTVLQQRLIDNIFINKEYDQFLYVLSLIAISYISYSLLFTIGSYALAKNMSYFLLSLSKDLIKHLYNISTALFQKKRTGEYVHHFSVDIENIAGLLGWDIPRLLQQLLSVLLLTFIIAATNIYMLLLIIAFNVLYIILAKYLGNMLRKMSKIINKKESRILVRLEECISSSREVLIFNKIKWEQQLLNQLFERYYVHAFKEEKIRSKQLLANESLKWGTSLMVLIIGGYEVYIGSMSIGALVVVFQLSLQLADGIKLTYDLIFKTIRRVASIDNLKQEYDRNVIKENVENNEEIIGEKINIRLNDVSYKHSNNNNYSLNKLSIEMPHGKKIALVGSSGSGKSTVINLLLKFDFLSFGDIKANNLSLVKVKNNEWFKEIGVVFQEPYLFSNTIRNNITLGTKVSDEKLDEILKIVCLDDYIRQLPDGYETIIGERGLTLSGGQRQRLALARALIREPNILILDEATSALDIATEDQIMKNLDGIREKKTTIIVAHRLSTIENSDLIYVFDRGMLVEQGRHQDLMENNSLYKKLVIRDMKESINF